MCCVRRKKTLDVQGVVDVREMLTDRRNIHVEVVGTSTEDITRITDALHELGLTINSSEIMRQRRVQPFNHFFFTGALDDDAERED